MNIALNDFFADPCLCPFTTGSDDLLENSVQPKLKLFFFESASQTVRDVKRIEQNDPARIWRKPGDLSALHRHREYPGTIGFKEERCRNNARSTSIVHARSCQSGAEWLQIRILDFEVSSTNILFSSSLIFHF